MTLKKLAIIIICTLSSTAFANNSFLIKTDSTFTEPDKKAIMDFTKLQIPGSPGYIFSMEETSESERNFKGIILLKIMEENSEKFLEAESRVHDNDSTSYKTKEKITAQDNGFGKALQTVIKRIEFKNRGLLDKITELRYRHDTQKNPILSWQSHTKSGKFIIFRSEFNDKNFSETGRSDKAEYLDRKCKPGLKYWYKVKSIQGETTSDFSETVSAFKEPPKIKGESLNRALAKKKKRIRKISGKNKQKEVFLKQYYWNNIKLRLILFLAKPYITQGTLNFYTDNGNYIVDDKKRTVTVKKDNTEILIYSKSFSRFYRKIKKTYPKETKEFMDRIMKNSSIFCIYKGLKEEAMEDGKFRYIHHYDAMGITSEYFKNRSDWSEKTLLFGTSNKELRKKMFEVQNKNRRDNDDD